MLRLIQSLLAKPRKSVTASQAIQKINAGAIVIDVRERDEFVSGSVLGAFHVPLSQIDRQGVAAVSDIAGINTQDVLLICRSGARSGAACTKLQVTLGERAYNLEGGLVAWTAAGLPLVTSGG